MLFLEYTNKTFNLPSYVYFSDCISLFGITINNNNDVDSNNGRRSRRLCHGTTTSMTTGDDLNKVGQNGGFCLLPVTRKVFWRVQEQSGSGS